MKNALKIFSVNYPILHVLRISEEAEKKKEEQAKNAKLATVNLAKPLSLNKPKSVAFVQVGCEEPVERPVQLASIKLHKSTELGSDVYLMQGKMTGNTFLTKLITSGFDELHHYLHDDDPYSNYLGCASLWTLSVLFTPHSGQLRI